MKVLPTPGAPWRRRFFFDFSRRKIVLMSASVRNTPSAIRSATAYGAALSPISMRDGFASSGIEMPARVDIEFLEIVVGRNRQIQRGAFRNRTKKTDAQNP